jgi:hypothetical protein
MLRWWDGQRWTPAQLPLRPPPPPRPRPAIPPYLGRTERLGRIAIVARASLLILTAALYARVLSDWLRDYSRLLAGTPGQAPLVDFNAFVRNSLLLAGSSLLLWVPIGLLAIWTYRCATAGAALGIPATNTPALGAAGWVIPVLHYWFPYQAVRDSLPPGHPARRTAAWWWGGDLGTSVVMPAVALVAVFGLVPFLIVWIVFAIVAVATAVLGLRVARAIDDAHRAAEKQVDAEGRAEPARSGS